VALSSTIMLDDAEHFVREVGGRGSCPMRAHPTSCSIAAGMAVLLLAGHAMAQGAPGAPGLASTWTFAGKTGIGTSYERYVAGHYQDGGSTGAVSKVWFTIAQGIVTETAHGLIHQAQIRDLQLLVTGNGFFDEEKVATDHRIAYLHNDTQGRPLSLAYRLTNTAKTGKYRIEKDVFTDPDRQTLFMRVRFTANENGLTPYLLVNPSMQNTGAGDVAYAGADHLGARQGEEAYLVLRGTAPFAKTSAGFEGVTDGWQDLHADRVMDWAYPFADAGPEGGWVAMTAQLPTLAAGETATWDFAVGFGPSHAEAMAQADGSLADGYDAVLARYNGVGAAVGWEDYLASLEELPRLAGATGDGGRLLQASALALKAMEDKTRAGALIASLSIPWGDVLPAQEPRTGYRAVWPRDFYQCAMALLALGDGETPVVALRYLEQVQVGPRTPGNAGAVGWFLQKTRVDGELEWVRLQMDQTAMPVMLGWRLWRAGLVADAEIADRYRRVLKPAAEFLANGGRVDITDPGGSRDQYQVDPPWTRLERWEEQSGYSPSNAAAVVTGLVAAADIARGPAGDPGAADWYETRADLFAANLERSMVTTAGDPATGPGSLRYYLRITKNQDPNDGQEIDASNGQPALDERRVLDPGFLELVRYGVRSAEDALILASLERIDDTSLPEDLRVRYDFACNGATVPGFRRYGGDGYGERRGDGSAYRHDAPDQRGRVWPLLTGERGHFELERRRAARGGAITAADRAELVGTYAQALECFANDGLMLPEQVWDGIGRNDTYGFSLGEGTNSATPLAWSHAEYVKLVRSIADGAVWDASPVARTRYAARPASALPQLFLRGTSNGWKLTPMRLVADHLWRVEALFDGPEPRFKLDTYGDWSVNFGDDDHGGTADRNGGDIPVTGGDGRYAITFDDRSRRYTITRR
jgi:glucoamylase